MRDSSGGGVVRSETDVTPAAAVVVTINVTLSALASEPLFSPRANSNQIRIVPGSSAKDKDLARDTEWGNAKARALAASVRTVPGKSVDLAHAPRPSFAPKDPRYEQALRQSQTQIAPLK